MEGNVFSTYTNTVREIFADTDESIAKFIVDGNIPDFVIASPKNPHQRV